MALGNALLRVRGSGGVKNVMLVISHPMHTGTRKHKKTKRLIPAHYITSIDYKLNGTSVAHMTIGPAISKNPFFRIYIKGSGKLQVTYRDNKGKSWTKSKNV